MPIRTLFTLLTFLPLLNVSLSAQSYTDSLWQEVQSAPNDSLKAENLILLSWEVLFSDPDSGRILARQAGELARKNDYPYLEIKSISNTGIAYAITGEQEQAEAHFQQGLELAMTHKDSAAIATFLNSMGNLNYDDGHFTKSLDIYLRALEVRESLADTGGIAAALMNIGGVYVEMEDFREAEIYYDRALTMELELGREKGIGTGYHNLAGIYEEERNYEKAKTYYLKADSLYQEMGFTYGLAVNYEGFGNVYFYLKDYPRSRDAYFAALELYEDMDIPYGIASAKIEVAEVFIYMNDLPQAARYAEEGLKLAESETATHLESIAHEHLSMIFEQQGNTKQALYHLKQHHLLKDSIQNEDRIKELAQLSMRYTFQKEKEQEKVQKALEKRADAARIQARNLRQYLYIFGGFILLLVAGLILSRFLKAGKFRGFVAFLAVMTFYQFILVLLDPWIFEFTGGVPIPNFLTSVGVAALFAVISQGVRKWAGRTREGEQLDQQ